MNIGKNVAYTQHTKNVTVIFIYSSPFQFSVSRKVGKGSW